MNDATTAAIRTTVAALVGGAVGAMTARKLAPSDTRTRTALLMGLAPLAAGTYAALVTALANHLHPSLGVLLGTPDRPGREDDLVEESEDYEGENMAVLSAEPDTDRPGTPGRADVAGS